MKKDKPPEATSEEFRRFADLTRRLVGVPKAEADERQREYARQKEQRRRKKPRVTHGA